MRNCTSGNLEIPGSTLARRPEMRCKNGRSDVGLVTRRSSLGRSSENLEETADVKNLPLPVVRRRGRGGREILRFAAAGFQNRKGAEEQRRQSHRKGRFGAGGGVYAGWPALHGAERRYAVRIHPCGLLQDRLRRSGRGRSA